MRWRPFAYGLTLMSSRCTTTSERCGSAQWRSEESCRRGVSFRGRFNGRVRAQCKEHQQNRADHQHIVGEVKDRAIKVNRIHMKVNEIANLAVGEPVVAVTNGAGHDQAERRGELEIAARSVDEEIVADGHGGKDREAGKDLAAIPKSASESPK